MKPYSLIVPVAVVCALGTGYSAFVQNNAQSMEAGKIAMTEAAKDATKAELEERRANNLRVLALEAFNGKLATVVFDPSSTLIRTKEMPKSISTEQFFTIGYVLPESLKVSSVGIFNLATGEYAAIGTLKGNPQILNVYTDSEVRKAMTRVQ